MSTTLNQGSHLCQTSLFSAPACSAAPSPKPQLNAATPSPRGTVHLTKFTRSSSSACLLRRPRPRQCAAQRAFTSHSRTTVSYTHLRAHETRHDLVCRLLL